MFICVCKGIREAEFSTLALCHGACPDAMRQAMGLDDSCCGRCEANLETMMQQVLGCLVMPSGVRDR
jgi:bacterioferritin-associated ferredoxin